MPYHRPRKKKARMKGKLRVFCLVGRGLEPKVRVMAPRRPIKLAKERVVCVQGNFLRKKYFTRMLPVSSETKYNTKARIPVEI